MSISFLRKIIKIFIKLLPVIDLMFTSFAMSPDMVIDTNTLAQGDTNTAVVYEV